MNNKGQSLVVFVILLPVFLLIIAFSIDLGYIAIENNKLNDINKTSLKYLVRDNKNIDTVKDIIKSNDKDIKIDKISSNEIILSKKINSIFGKVIDLNEYKIVSDLKGKINNNRLVIEKG